MSPYHLIVRDGRKLAYVKHEPTQQFFNGREVIPNKEVVCSFIRLCSKDSGKERLYYPLESENKFYFEDLKPGNLFVTPIDELKEDEVINETLLKALAENNPNLLSTETEGIASSSMLEHDHEHENNNETEHEHEHETTGENEEVTDEPAVLPEHRHPGLVCTCILDNNPELDSSDFPLLWKNRKNANIYSLFFTFYNEFDILCQYHHNGHVCNKIITFKNKLQQSKDRTKAMEKHFKIDHDIRTIDLSQIPTMLCFDRPNVQRLSSDIYRIITKNRIGVASLPKVPVAIPSTKAEEVPIERNANVYDFTLAEKAFIDTAKLFRKWNIPYQIFDDPDFQAWAKMYMKEWDFSNNSRLTK
ncbi:uncharacterized protein PWA37_001583 [Arxiozyma heterogenica]|uniref:uncharacterized protein n=1 Tax=Arxiozyma heterogenica TaxID=278026 RepID=UPI002F0BE2C6